MKVTTRCQFALALNLFLVSLAYAQETETKILASDGAQGDEFGYSVAIDGGIAVVGAVYSDHKGANSGSAYIFDVSTASEIGRLLANDGSKDDEFGHSIAIEGDIVLVGAAWDGAGAGAAYLFDISNPSAPIEVYKLEANDSSATRLFGFSVAIEGNTAIVGAAWDDDNGSRSGAAYLFDITDPFAPIQVAKIKPNDGIKDDWFGTTLGVSGSLALVGASWHDAVSSDSGAAYLFDISDPTAPVQTAKLIPGDGEKDDRFGVGVAIDATTAIVGSSGDDDWALNSGSAYVFDLSDPTAPTQQAKLLAADGAANDYFGMSVAIEGVLAVVGASSDDDMGQDSGAAYIFELSDPTAPLQIHKLLASDGAQGDRFGYRNSIYAGTVLVAAVRDDVSRGSAYLYGFDCNGNGIPDQDELNPTTDCDGNRILDECEIADDPSLDCDGDTVLDSCQIAGNPSLDCDGNMILDTCDIASDPTLDCDVDGILDSCEIVGDPSLDCDVNGILDPCQIAGDPSLDQDGDGVLDSCQCAFSNFCISTNNSTGQVGTIGWSGSASISAADLTLTGSNLPINQFGIFFYGADEWFKIMGDGVLCIAPPLHRIKTVVTTGPTGTANLTLDYGSQPLASGAGQVTAFSTWRFQLWYRDPTGGPAGSNTTDGLMVTFCP